MLPRWVGAVHFIFIFIALKERVDTYSLGPYSLAKYVKHLNTKPPVVVVVDVNEKTTPDHDSGHYHSDGNYYNHGKKEGNSLNEYYDKKYHSDGYYYYHGNKKVNAQSEYRDSEFYHSGDNDYYHGKKKTNSLNKYTDPNYYDAEDNHYHHGKKESYSQDTSIYSDPQHYHGSYYHHGKKKQSSKNDNYDSEHYHYDGYYRDNGKTGRNLLNNAEDYNPYHSDLKEHYLIHRLKDIVTQLKHNKELEGAINSEDAISNAKKRKMDKIHLLNHILKVAEGRESYYGRLPPSVLREALISYKNCLRKQMGGMRSVFCSLNDHSYKKDKKKWIDDSKPQWGDCFGGHDHCEDKQNKKKGKGTGRTMPPELKNTMLYSE